MPKYRYDYRELFLANLMDASLDRDQVINTVNNVIKDCLAFGVDYRDKPLRQVLKELKEAEEKL